MLSCIKPCSTLAGVDLPWSTTYECKNFKQNSSKLSYDGLEWGGGWTCKGKKEEIIPILQQVQEKIGYLPEEAMLEIAQFTGEPESHIYGIATFYTQFRFTPIGRKHIMIP